MYFSGVLSSCDRASLTSKRKGGKYSGRKIDIVVLRSYNNMIGFVHSRSEKVRFGFEGLHPLETIHNIFLLPSFFPFFLIFSLSLSLSRLSLTLSLSPSSNSLFKSRDWLSANQGPVFSNSVEKTHIWSPARSHQFCYHYIHTSHLSWKAHTRDCMCATKSQPRSDTSKQPIRTRYLGHVTGYQPIRDHCFLIRSRRLTYGPPRFHQNLVTFLFTPSQETYIFT
eukprot:sb/3469688/